jgi:hypothetical protein
VPPPDEREAFEAAVRSTFVCGEHSFVRAQPYGYINTVQSQTFGGRVRPNYADVQMLWEAWQARAALPAAQPTVNPPEFQEVSWGVDSVMRPCLGMAVSEYAFRQWAKDVGIVLAAPVAAQPDTSGVQEVPRG